MTTTIKNARQIREAKQRLHLREVELKELIDSDWSEITGGFHDGPKLDIRTKHVIAPRHEEESILVSTLAYAGALLGRKLGFKVEEKISGYFNEEE